MISQINAIGVCLIIINILCGIDGEDDTTSRGDEINSSDNEIHPSKCKHLTTNNDSYIFYPVEDIRNERGFFLKFNVKAERGVHIIFSSTNLTENSDHKGFEVVISGGQHDAISEIRTTQASEKDTSHIHYEKNMVSYKEWHQFWIRITSDGTLIEVGKKGSIPFMSSRTKPRLIEYYGFASDNNPINYAFLCFERNNIDVSQYRTLTTYDDAYTFYPIEEMKNNGTIFLEFMVKTDQDAHIIFSPTNETVKKDEKIFKVILGGHTNRISAIKTSELDEPGSKHPEEDILLPDEWRSFWIRITQDGASIQVGKNGSSAFMSLKTEPRPIKYYGFASSGSFANWAFPSLKKNNVVTNVCIPSPCGPNSECKQKDNHAICSCKKNQLDSPSTCRFECIFNSECPQDKACIGKTCQDPCAGMCGKNTNTKCEVENHAPICSCIAGLTGDPSTECVKEEDLPKYRSSTTHFGGHTYYPISVIKNDKQIFMKFNVKTEAILYITFHSTNPFVTNEYQDFILTFGSKELKTEIRSQPLLSAMIYNEYNLLSNEEWRPFWIRITPDGSSIEVGKNIGKLPFMSIKKDPQPIKYFAFTTLGVCHWNFVSSKDTNIDLLRYRTHSSGSTHSTLYPIADINSDDEFFLEFNLKAKHSAQIIFTEKNDPEISASSKNDTKYQDLDIFYVVIENTHLSIRTTPAGEEQVSYHEENLISSEEWRIFWIRITTDGSSIEVGKNGGRALASLETKPRIIKYFGFSSDEDGAWWAFPPQKAKFLVFL
ncbi:uncharacterized protein LOC135847999 [Planococcus citri]|uniref:uncharacterized protein LOC135847999 n=1 Tax=Planococcus citri TaxID=170843 RepID=UPI0031F8DFDF